MPGISRSSVRTPLAAASALVLLAAVPGRGFAQKFERVSLPVPVEVDGALVHCPLYLDVELKRYNIPFDKFSAGPLDKPQTMLVTAVEAIRKRDTAKFASVWTSPDQMKRLSQTTTVTLTDNSAANWADAARSNFDFDHLNVVAEVLVGSETMFVWEASTKSGIRRDAFYVGFDKNNRPRLSIASSNSPVLSLIKSAFDAQGTANGAFEASSNVHLPYQYPIPLAGNRNPGTHPVYLEFDGTPMDFPVGDEKVSPPTPLLASMRKAARDARNGRNDAFSRDFTPRSGERVKQWLDSSARRNQATNFASTAVAGMNPVTAGMQAVLASNVKFVLDASPVFLVFQAAGNGSNWPPDSLTYSYVVRDGGTYKLANFSSSDDFDDFLQSPALFDKTILKSAPRSQPPSGTTPNLR
ncbi:MAG TPA: hypothetical protein VHY79_15230 [Rhizomicrobium sp.]|jgi:hypothetical protein|nr:hypothetical protein [Rhizomicrobium sp.]